MHRQGERVGVQLGERRGSGFSPGCALWSECLLLSEPRFPYRYKGNEYPSLPQKPRWGGELLLNRMLCVSPEGCAQPGTELARQTPLPGVCAACTHCAPRTAPPQGLPPSREHRGGRAGRVRALGPMPQPSLRLNSLFPSCWWSRGSGAGSSCRSSLPLCHS